MFVYHRILNTDLCALQEALVVCLTYAIVVCFLTEES